MNSNRTDESKNRRQEEMLARRLGETLEQSAPQGEPCLDAEWIAAYHERSLDPEEMEQCEMHFAACSRCRKTLTMLTATDQTPLAEKEVTILGEVAAATVHASRDADKTERRRWISWRTPWLAPVLGVAAALIVWVAVRPPWRAPNQDSSGTLIAQAPAEELTRPEQALPEKQSPPPATPQKAPETRGASRADRAIARETAPAPAAEALAKNRSAENNSVAAVKPGEAPAGDAARTEKKAQAELKSVPAAAPASRSAATAPAPPAPGAQAQAGGAASADVSAPNATTQSVIVTEQAPAVSTPNSTPGTPMSEGKSANVPMAARNYKALDVMQANGSSIVLINAPSGKNVWRAGSNGSIEISSDARQTWHAQKSPVQDDWLAGSAVSDKICWLAGRHGAIALTTNGKRWNRIISPAQPNAAGKLPDWTSISASSARAATITASDQRRFTTQDGGKTWQAQ